MHADPDQEMQCQHQFDQRTSLATHWICLKTQLAVHSSCRQKLIVLLQESPPSFSPLGLVPLGQTSQNELTRKWRRICSDAFTTFHV